MCVLIIPEVDPSLGVVLSEPVASKMKMGVWGEKIDKIQKKRQRLLLLTWVQMIMYDPPRSGIDRPMAYGIF